MTHERIERNLPVNQYDWYEVNALAEQKRFPEIGRHAEPIRDDKVIWPQRWNLRVVQN